ncbi:MAG: tail fiber protein [bacterium]|nr:tail fiber protein [bacterium]
MYANISNLKNEINSLKETINALSGTQSSSANSLQDSITLNESRITNNEAQIRMAAPAGTIAPFAGPEGNLPEGWLLCDGSSVSRDTYDTLFQAIDTSWGSADGSSFNLPDLQGRFLRGLDIAGIIDPGRAVGSYQNDAFQDHKHQWCFSESHSDNDNDYSLGWDTRLSRLQGQYKHDTTGNVTGRSAAETRPINAAVNYIIKY